MASLPEVFPALHAPDGIGVLSLFLKFHTVSEKKYLIPKSLLLSDYEGRSQRFRERIFFSINTQFCLPYDPEKIVGLRLHVRTSLTQIRSAVVPWGGLLVSMG